MPPSVKPGTPARYWKEVEALMRLGVALERDETLEDAKRRRAVEAAETLKGLLVSLAKGRAA